MATTQSLAATRIVVNAYGSPAGGIWPHFRLIADGTEVGQATVSATSPTAYSFDTRLSAGQPHTIKVYFDNDAYLNGEDRNLGLKSIVVNGHTMLPTDGGVTYDRYALDGQDVVAGQEGMWWQGAIAFTAPASDFAATPTPAGTPATITVNASGTPANGVNAHFKLLVDGQKVGEATVGTTAKDYNFTANLTADQAHKVQVQYDNDAVVNGQDRSLRVNTVTVNGHTVKATDAGVTYDKGALDGKDVVAGQSSLPWNGTLVVNADKSWFPGSSTTPTTPNPTTPSLSVDSVSVSEPGVTNTTSGGGIASGFLHTDGNQIVDSAGHNVRLTGVNWFGFETETGVPHGLWTRGYQETMDQMKSLGFNVIRLPYSDSALGTNPSSNTIDYSKNPDLNGLSSLQVMDRIVDYAGKIGMKIILDHHRSSTGSSANENGLWYDGQFPESKMIENWKMLAQRYAGKEAVVGADLHNEPHGAATWGDNSSNDWAHAAERIGNAIQSVNKDWLMIVEGTEVYNNQWDWWGGNLRGAKAYDVHFNTPDKLVYSVHSYGPSLHSQSWFQDSNYPNNLPGVYTDNWGWLMRDNKHPVLVGEFGAFMRTTADQQYMAKLTQYMNGDLDGNGTLDLGAGKQGASWTYWSWNPNSGDTGGILTDDWKTVDATKYNAIKGALSGGTSTTTVTPGQTDAVFTVKLSQAAGQPVTVNYATVDGTAKAGSDYKAASGSLTFNAGETVKQVKVTVLGDTVAEGSESFGLKLSGASNATIAAAQGTGTIVEGAKAAALANDGVDLWAAVATRPADPDGAVVVGQVAPMTPVPDPVEVVPGFSPHQFHDGIGHWGWHQDAA